jgi:hypothetical protein
MLMREPNAATSKLFNRPFSLSLPITFFLVWIRTTSKSPAERETYILHFILIESQYTKLNFSYQSGLFFSTIFYSNWYFWVIVWST